MAKYQDNYDDYAYEDQFVRADIVEIRKNRIRKGIGSVILAASVLVGVSGLALESGIDHTEDLCPYCAVVGYDHQINKINRQNKNLHAEYDTRYDLPEGATLVFDEFGNSYARFTKTVPILEKYVVPKGYKLEKNLNDEWIGVARNASGDITGIADPELVKYLDIPEGYTYKDGYACKDVPIDKEEVIKVTDTSQNSVNYIPLK